MKCESGAEQLRATVNVLNNSKEDAISPYSAIELVIMVEAIRRCPWDITPCDLLPSERQYAAQFGELSAETMLRLERRLG